MNSARQADVTGHAAVRRRVCVLAVAVVLAVYAWIVLVHVWQPSVCEPSQQPYNLQADGLRAGQLNLLKDVPPGFARLKDPYDPAATLYFRMGGEGFKLHDLSYYHGKLYMYFGITPVVVLFGPWLVVTGGHFPQELAVLLFCAVGYVTSAWLYCRMAGRFFPDAGPFVIGAGLLALGLATGILPLLLRPEMYEVAISCGYACVMLSLAMVWRSIEATKHRGLWLALASAAYGLAIGSRPSLLFGAVILLAPLAWEWLRGEKTGRLRVMAGLIPAAMGPIAAAGVGLLIFNAARFGSPVEFGIKYQLAAVNVSHARLFNPSSFGYNLRLCFLEPVVWTTRSWFPIGVRLPQAPEGYLGAENPFGIFTSVPFVLLAAVLLSKAEPRREFRWMTAIVLASAAASVAIVCTFAGVATRYEAEFLPALMLLAALGLLGLERLLARHTRARLVTRCAWGVALAYSLVVGVLVGASEKSVYSRMRDANMRDLLEKGHWQEPLAWFEAAVRRYPQREEGFLNLGLTYYQLERLADSVPCFERSLELNPKGDYVHNLLGIVLFRLGRIEDARTHFRRALEINPKSLGAAENLERLALHPDVSPKAEP